MSAGGTAVRAVGGDSLELWCRDLVSCLHATFATVLRHAGHEPLEVLGAHWEFRFRPGDVRPEEFYYPCRIPGDLAASLAPHHPVSSCWRQPDPAADPLRQLAAVLAGGELVIAAVDNFYLPFRPAFTDVHAAHLVIVYGVDAEAGLVHVHDAMPPAFSGEIAADDFLRAWSSWNPQDPQDAFFSDSRIDRRFMTVAVDGPIPALDPVRLRAILVANLAGFAGDAPQPDAGADWVGMPGLERWLDHLRQACRDGDRDLLADSYPFGWAMQAQADLHAELLRGQGNRLDVPELREAARQVEAVAHAWTGLRMSAAHGLADPAACAPDVHRHATALRRSHEAALSGLAEAVQAL